MEEYDIVVAGAGVAGSLAAASARINGAEKVLLLDRNDIEHAGKKTNWGWVCGDAVAKTHIDFVSKELNLSFGKEIDQKVNGVYVLSPDLSTKFLFEGEGYSLNRPELGRSLVNFAIKKGVEFRGGYEVEGPIIKNSKVVGVFGKDEKKQNFEIYAKIVIDALGIASTLRRKLPQNEFIDREVDIHDIEATGRYIAKVDINDNDLNYYDKDNAIIHLNQELAPGGYGWVFPKTGNRVNIGVGVEKSSLEIRNKKLKKNDNLHSLIDAYVSWNKAIKIREIDQTDNNGKGYWSVSVRRQMESLVIDNYMGAGDSMAMPNPVSAGGIGPAMTAGVLSGKVAADAIINKDTSIDFLWKYNLLYNEKYGSKTGALEVFRIYLQSLSNDVINYGMKNFLTKKEAISLAYGEDVELSLADKFTAFISGLKNISAFKNLLYTVNKMREMNRLYNEYPKSPKEFKDWKNKVNNIIKEVKEKFPPNPI